jgi:hypothetical protein
MIYRKHREQFLKGWSIPVAMEWLFWPMGYTTYLLKRQEILQTREAVNVPIPAYAFIPASARFAMSNRAWEMETGRAL